MNKFLSIFLLGVIFLGVFTSEKAKFAPIDLDVVVNGKIANSSHAGDCGDEGLACHQCHLGHCAFTVLSSSDKLLIVSITNSFLESEYVALKSNITANLLRPPIC